MHSSRSPAVDPLANHVDRRLIEERPAERHALAPAICVPLELPDQIAVVRVAGQDALQRRYSDARIRHEGRAARGGFVRFMLLGKRRAARRVAAAAESA